MPPPFITGAYITGGYELEAPDCPVMRQALGIPELLRSIFEFLPQEGLVAAMCTCRYWFDMATDVHWSKVHVHYLNYVSWNRQQYYANKITTVSLRHVQARNAYVASKWLKFPRIRYAYFEADNTQSGQDQQFLFPYIGAGITQVSAHSFNLDSTFFDLLHQCLDLRSVAFGITPVRRFPDFDAVVGEQVDKILHEPSVNDLIAHESSAERIAAAKSMLKLIANRPKLHDVRLGYGTEYLVTKQLILACAKLRDLDLLYVSRPLSDPLAAEIASITPSPFQEVTTLIITTQSYSIPKIAPLCPKLGSLQLSIRDAESGKLMPSLGTLTSLRTMFLDVPVTTKIKGEEMTWLSSLINLREFRLTLNKVQIPWLSPAAQVGFGDNELRAMVSCWSQMEELSLPFGTGLTEKTFFALGHSCPKLRSLKIPQIEEFGPFVFEPLGEPLFPELQSMKLTRIIPGPPPQDAPEDFENWWEAYVSSSGQRQELRATADDNRDEPDRTISKFMPVLHKHFPKLRSFDCPNPGGRNNFLWRSWDAVARDDADPDKRKPSPDTQPHGNFQGTDGWSDAYYNNQYHMSYLHHYY